ncbi:hypothetical protein IV417_15895 [Alphaproteobacteria bacterium KMM 3653]|uniref:Tryptophan-rich sensory protein n=1 Tax=Harenicola maris TaxID=2841044 RepID=A0AAP2G9D2_9RHOB|nr:hypothetical protein [Harenicola maris]
MTQSRLKPILVAVAALAFAAAPFLSPEFGGFDPDRYPIPQNDPPVQPAGWAFSIWGVIYLWLLVHAGMGLMRGEDAEWDAGRWMLFASLVIGAAWLPVALASPVWATLMIWVMLFTALGALGAMGRARPDWAARWPVAFYAGWLTAACFVSVGLMLGGYGVMGEGAAAVLCLVLATAAALGVQRWLALWPYGASAAWGFVGIAIANQGSATGISLAAFAAAALVAGYAAYQRLIA